MEQEKIDEFAKNPRDDESRSPEDRTADELADELPDAEETIVVSKSDYDKLLEDLSAAQDRGLRALAELENFRARAKRTEAESRKYAAMDLARAILPVWDNLNLALQIEDPEKNGASVLEGVKMVCAEFLRILDQNGIEKIDALHKPFDPKFHESVAFVPTNEYEPNTVVVEIKTGFMLHDRVVRATQVALAAPVAPSTTDA